MLDTANEQVKSTTKPPMEEVAGELRKWYSACLWLAAAIFLKLPAEPASLAGSPPSTPATFPSWEAEEIVWQVWSSELKVYSSICTLMKREM